MSRSKFLLPSLKLSLGTDPHSLSPTDKSKLSRSDSLFSPFHDTPRLLQRYYFYIIIPS